MKDRDKKGRFIKGHKVSGETKKKIGEAQKGKIISEEVRKKLSEALTGHKGYWLDKKFSEEHKKKISKNTKGNKNCLGFKHTEESKKKISLASKGRKFSEEFKKRDSERHKGKLNWMFGRRGELHPQWKGDDVKLSENERIRRTADYYDWRKSVFERDNYTCQICGKRGGYLNAHHIKPFKNYPELRFDTNNGITLCKKCHKEIHKKIKREKEIKELELATV